MPSGLSSIACVAAVTLAALACNKGASSKEQATGASTGEVGHGGTGAAGERRSPAGEGRVTGDLARAAGGAAGCAPGSTGPPSSNTNPPATWATLKLVLTAAIPGNPPCASADCHGAGGPNPFQLNPNDDDQMYRSITSTIAKDCGDVPVVTPGAPTKSALLTALRGPCSCSVPRMPRGCDSDPNNNICLPADYVSAIEQWIAKGASKP